MRKLLPAALVSAVITAVIVFASSPRADTPTTGGGLSRVVHDSTLTGSGTTANPLGVTGGIVGDITGVTAGSGLTGGGTSATVTLDITASADFAVGADLLDLSSDVTAAGVATIGRATTTGTGVLNLYGNGNQLQLQSSASAATLDIKNNGSLIWDIDPTPAAGTDDSTIRFFRHTNTTGAKNVDINVGNTGTVGVRMSSSGASWIDGQASSTANSGLFAIGHLTPEAPLDVRLGNSAQTASNKVVYVSTASNTYNTTAGALTSSAIEINHLSTRASGANTLTNYGLYVNVANGQTNYDFYGAAGTFYQASTSSFNDDATFESGTCVINSAGITCGGTLITPAADITSVVAGNGLTGGATSGAATLDVACSTGLTCNANDIAITDRDFGDITASSSGSTWTIDNSTVTSAKLNITTTSCSAGQHVSAISAGGVGTCTADSGGVTGTGTSGKGARWNGTTSIADASFSDTGSILTVGNTTGTVESISLSGTVNDQTLTATTTILAINATGTVNLSGITGGAAGRLLVVTNVTTGGNTIILKHNITSTAGNRFSLPDAQTDWYLNEGGAILLVYDGTNSRWKLAGWGSNSFPKLIVPTVATFSTSGISLAEVVTASHSGTGLAVTNNATVGGTLAITGDTTVNTNKFTVAASTGNTTVAGTFDVASTLTVATSQLLDVKDRTRTKFLSGDTTTPTLSSCGTSPSIDANSNNLAGKFTVGTTAGAACTITFNGTWPVAPWCHIERSNGTTLGNTNFTTTTTTIPIVSGIVDSVDYYYWCTGGN